MQLILRKKLQQIGYKVGGLGTEPSALLFGIDRVYPIGYGRVCLSGTDAVETINRYMHEVDEKSYDIIITGSQSQTIPYNLGNSAHYPLAQHEFFVGTAPDAVILCINPFDELDYIKRTMDYLESYLYSKVLSLVMFPKYRTLEWAVQGTKTEELSSDLLKERQKFYMDALNVPCYVAGNDVESDCLIEIITDYFSE